MAYLGFCDVYGVRRVPTMAVGAPLALNGLTQFFMKASVTSASLSTMIVFTAATAGFFLGEDLCRMKQRELRFSKIGTSKGSKIIQRLQLTGYAIPVIAGLAISTSLPIVIKGDPILEFVEPFFERQKPG